jgi:Beta-propeller repeat
LRSRHFPCTRVYGLLGALMGVLGATWCEAQAPPKAPAAPSRHAQAAAVKAVVHRTVPLSFEVNAGQVRGEGSERVRFLARGRGYTLFLTSTGAILKFHGRSRNSGGKSSGIGLKFPITGDRETPTFRAWSTAVLRQKLVGANPRTKAVGLEELPGKTNYLVGSDPAKWQRDIATYRQVKLEGVYPGIDAVYYGRDGEMEYDFVVAPGADPKAIRLVIETGDWTQETQTSKSEDRLAGATTASGNSRRPADSSVEYRVPAGEGVRIAANGDLVAVTAAGEIRLRKPVVYQASPPSDVDGGLKSTHDGSGAAVRRPASSVKRKYLDAHYLLRPSRDPDSEIKNGYEVSFQIASFDPAKPLIIDPVLSYSTYLGGSGFDYAYGVAADASGNAYVTGQTNSLDFPTGNPSQEPMGGGTCGTSLDVYPCFDAFVTKLSATGSSVVYSTYLGGSGDDRGMAIAVDSSGNAYVTGYTDSADFPVAK